MPKGPRCRPRGRSAHARADRAPPQRPRSTRPRPARCGRCSTQSGVHRRPHRVPAPAEDLHVVAERRRVGAGHVGDHVAHATSPLVLPERRDRPHDVVGPAFDHPCTLTSSVAGSSSTDTTSPGRMRSRARSGSGSAMGSSLHAPPGSSTTAHPAPASSSPGESRPSQKSPLGARGRTSFRDRPHLRAGVLAHGRRLGSGSDTASRRLGWWQPSWRCVAVRPSAAAS